MFEALSAVSPMLVLAIGAFGTAGAAWAQLRKREHTLADLQDDRQREYDWWTAQRAIHIRTVQPAAPFQVSGPKVTIPILVWNISPREWTLENLRFSSVLVDGLAAAYAIAPARIAPCLRSDDNGAPASFQVDVVIPQGVSTDLYLTVQFSHPAMDAFDPDGRLFPVAFPFQTLVVMIKQ